MRRPTPLTVAAFAAVELSLAAAMATAPLPRDPAGWILRRLSDYVERTALGTFAVRTPGDLAAMAPRAVTVYGIARPTYLGE